MSVSEVTRAGQQGIRPDRDAIAGVRPAEFTGRKGRGGGRGERAMVPPAEFTSYYGKPVLNPPVWKAPDIPGYFFFGGLAGASSLLAAGAEISDRPALARIARLTAVAGVSGGLAGLVHDLGRPARFVNMLRVFKVTSPMSVGSWLLAGYTPLAGAAAATELTGVLPGIGQLAGRAAALLGPLVASYTAVLISDTAVPAWHDGYRELPFVFVGSSAAAAGGLAMACVPLAESAPARALALGGAATELAAMTAMERRLGLVAEPYSQGKGGKTAKVAKALTAAGAVVGAVAGRRSRRAAIAAGAMLFAGSLAERFAIFWAGMDSARDPKYTIVPQRERLAAR